MDHRIAYLDLCCGTFSVRLITVHLPHNGYATDDYEASLSALEPLISSARSSRRTCVVGIDANAVIGEQKSTDDELFIGVYGLGQRNARGDIFVPWLDGQRMIA